MAEVRKPIDNVPSPVDITIYQGSDQDISFYPFGTDTADLPANWATDYSYVLYIWDKTNPTTNLKTISGTNDGSTGLTSFPFSRVDRMALTWTDSKQYEATESVSGSVVEVPIAGAFTLMLRAGVS